MEPIETWRLTNWQNKYESKELLRRVREELSDEDIINFMVALEYTLKGGTFRPEDFGWVSTLQITMEKIRNGRDSEKFS